MFEDVGPVALVGTIEESRPEESRLMARRLAAVAALLWHRIGEAENGPDNDDPGYALISGFARAGAEVGAALNIAPMAAHQLVGQAEALDIRLPRIGALLADGRIDWATVKLVINRTSLVAHDLIGQVDDELAAQLASWTGWSRRRVINAIDAAVLEADPEAAKERRENADTERFIEFAAQPNGMAAARGSLPAPAAAIVDKRLDELARSVCARDSRTLRQRRVDAWVALSEGRGLDCDCDRPDCPAAKAAPGGASRFVINVIPAEGHGDDEKSAAAARTEINVVATQETVDGTSEQPGYLEGYGVIDADQVRQLARRALLRPVAEPIVSDAAALRYQPSAALERFIRCRDLTCRWPGCDRPAWRADIDHTTPFDHADPSAGGLTASHNNKCFCREHHRDKTFLDGWHDEQLPDGTVVFTSPTGRTYCTAPAGLDLFPQLRTRAGPLDTGPRQPSDSPCMPPAPRKRNRSKTKRARTQRARDRLAALRIANADVRRINRARRQEVDLRQWRNNMRRKLLVLKGGHRSSGPWCTWVNDPSEDEHISADWLPPPPLPQVLQDVQDDPPF